jgi:hypothetical protein
MEARQGYACLAEACPWVSRIHIISDALELVDSSDWQSNKIASLF